MELMRWWPERNDHGKRFFGKEFAPAQDGAARRALKNNVMTTCACTQEEEDNKRYVATQQERDNVFTTGGVVSEVTNADDARQPVSAASLGLHET